LLAAISALMQVGDERFNKDEITRLYDDTVAHAVE
jgi:hypothetical protein